MTSLELIKSLRDRTGASLGAVKKALDESNGDENAAIELLRKKGEAKAASRGDRNTNEGVVATATQGNKGAIVKLSCETDFVAKNEDFIKAAEDFAKQVLENGDGFDAAGEINELNLKMGEKVELAESKVIEADVIGDYVHSNRKVGALIGLSSGNEDMARDVAMHATAMNPLVTSPDEVDDALVEKEKEIWVEQLKNEGKPEEIMGKILEGKTKKFKEENALLKQPFVKNGDQTVEQFINGAEIKGFVRMEC